MSENWKKLEGLAKAGYYFGRTPGRPLDPNLHDSKLTDKILITDTDEVVVPLHKCFYPKSVLALGPEKDKLLLFSRDFFYKVDSSNIQQSPLPGVVQIYTQEHQLYIIHQTHDTLPPDKKFEFMTVKEYNRRKFQIHTPE